MREENPQGGLMPEPITDQKFMALCRLLTNKDEGGGGTDVGEDQGSTDLHRHSDGRAALRATLDTLRECAAEARNFAVQRLKELVAEISHRFWAPTAWLYVPEDDLLRAVVRRKTGRTDPTLRLDETSIVSLVAKTGESYYTNDAPNDPYFRPSQPSQSVMAAAMKSEDGNPIGVLCLESAHPDSRFTRALLDGLTKAVSELVPHVLVLETLDRPDEGWCPWHPRVHKWDLALVLRRICHAITAALDGEESDGVECAIWLADRQNGELSVAGTSGHGTEYVKEETLGFDSFTGSVADCPAWGYGRVRPRDQRSTLTTRTAKGWETREGHPFIMRYKQTFMGLTEVMAAPIHLTGSTGGGGEAACVLAIYAYGEEAARVLPDPEELSQIAETLGEVISAYQDQRERLAAAYFADALASQGPDKYPWIVTREFTEFLKLKEVRIYAAAGGDGELVAIDPHGAARLFDQGDGNREYLAALYDHPGVPVRVNNTHSRRPEFLANAPMRNAVGWSPWNDPDHHRFLDIGIAGFGVVRLVRSGRSKPFTPADERVVRRLASSCGSALRKWSEANRSPHAIGHTI